MTVGNSSLLGKTVGGYNIEEELGRGGMAAVYKALQLNLDRYVAIKILLPHLASDTEFVRRFQQEARAAASLKHPNIITIYDVGRDTVTDSYYIAMEYIEGESLKELLADSGALSRWQAMDVLRPLASALDHAHEKGFVHRDIKSSNILIEKGSGRAVLTDFGVAKALHEGSSMTQNGAFIGTVYYAAPEQIQGQPVDHRADLYAFGVLAYEVLSGGVPFSGTTMSVLYAQVHEPAPLLHEKDVRLPAGVDAVLGRMMAKRPGDRYETAQTFVGDLGRALQGESVLMKAAGGSLPQREREAEQRRTVGVGAKRSKIWLWAGLMAAVVLIGLGVLVAIGKRGTFSPQSRPGGLSGVAATRSAMMTKAAVSASPERAATTKGVVVTQQPARLVMTDTPVSLPTLTLIGTTGNMAPTPAMTTTEWTHYAQPRDGFSVNLPPSWYRLETNQQSVKTFFQTLDDQNPALTALWGAQSYTPQALFFALDTSPVSSVTGYMTTVSVARQTFSDTVSLDIFARAFANGLRKVSVVVLPITRRSVNLTNSHGEEIQYNINLTDLWSKNVALFVSQYFVTKGKDVYVLTLTTLSDTKTLYYPVFDRIIRSFRILGTSRWSSMMTITALPTQVVSLTLTPNVTLTHSVMLTPTPAFTLVPPTPAPRPPTAAPRPPTATPRPPTATPRPPTATPRPPTATLKPPTPTLPPTVRPKPTKGLPPTSAPPSS